MFTDSAGAGKALAEKAGLSWIGKHSNLLDRRICSWFFLGEIYVDLRYRRTGQPARIVVVAPPAWRICPTQAIVVPYRVDARRCILPHHRTARADSPEFAVPSAIAFTVATIASWFVGNRLLNRAASRFPRSPRADAPRLDRTVRLGRRNSYAAPKASAIRRIWP